MSKKPKKYVIPKMIAPRTKAPWPADAPAVNPNGVKVQVCPPFTPARPWTNTFSQ